jgi:hypothetical protein
MPTNDYVELTLPDHFEVTDKHTFPDKFSWDFSSFDNVTPLFSANPKNKSLLQSLRVEEIKNKIAYFAASQNHSLTTMRFELVFLDSGLIDMTYSGFNLEPVSLLSKSGHSLEIAIEYYQAK